MIHVCERELSEREMLITLASPRRPSSRDVSSGGRERSDGLEEVAARMKGVAESDMPQCHRCFHYLFLSGVCDRTNPRRISCLSPDCVKALQHGEPRGGAPSSYDIILAYRFTLRMLASLIPDCPSELLERAGRIDALFAPIVEHYPPLDIWFSPPAPLIKTADVVEAEGGRGGGAGGGGRGKSQDAGPKSGASKVPGKLYFGFCDEVVRAVKAMGGGGGWSQGGAGNGREAVERSGTGSAAAGGDGGLCKIEWDEGLNRPSVPVRVGHACVIESFGEVKEAGGQWVDPEGGFTYPVGFRSKRSFPSMVSDGKATYVCEVIEGEDGSPAFKISCEDDPSSTLVSASPVLSWEQVLHRVSQFKSSKRTRVG